MDLTQEQLNIIEAGPDIRMVVSADPGTGKTEVVARRLAYLLGPGGLRSSQVLVLSFSRTAVRALIERIRTLQADDPGLIEDLRYLSVRTFDSWSFRTLRFLGHEPSQLLQKGHDSNIALLIHELESRKDEMLAREELRLAQLRHVLVDEYQDLTGVRARLVQTLLATLCAPDASTIRGFTLLGDPNQAIYDWTARNDPNHVQLGSGDLVRWVRSDCGHVLNRPLSVNHRCKGSVGTLVKSASEELRCATVEDADPARRLWKLLQDGVPIESEGDIVQALNVPGRSRLAVLCRWNSTILDLAARLRDQVSPEIYRHLAVTTGSPPLLRPSWIAVLLHRFEGEQLTATQFRRIFDLTAKEGNVVMPCGGEATAAWQMLLTFARKGAEDNSLSLEQLRERLNWPDSLPDDEGVGDERVVLSTIHQAKGLEFDSVKLIESGESDVHDGSDPHEESRVLFVGISRARNDLSLIQVTSKDKFYQKQFEDGFRTRWHRWHKNGCHELEIGIDGDVDPHSFVSSDLPGGEDRVTSLQQMLAVKERELIGRSVVLHKVKIEGPALKFVYEMHLDDAQGLLLGRTREQLTYDLLKIKHVKQSLPVNIYSLRISAITTLACQQLHADIPSPWSKSGLWLGVSIHGIASCKFFWKDKA